VEKYKKVYHIGEVDPSDMVPSDRMSAKERAKVVRRNAIRKDFEDLRQMAIEKVHLRRILFVCLFKRIRLIYQTFDAIKIN
jgi:hypothetical protein